MKNTDEKLCVFLFCCPQSDADVLVWFYSGDLVLKGFVSDLVGVLQHLHQLPEAYESSLIHALHINTEVLAVHRV